MEPLPMKNGSLFWKADKQFGRIDGENGEDVIFDPKMPHSLNLTIKHDGTKVTYKAVKIRAIDNTYYATKVLSETDIFSVCETRVQPFLANRFAPRKKS